MKDKIKKIFKNENIRCMAILIIISFIMCIPLLKENVAVYHDDGIQHISRAYGTFEAIKSGVLFCILNSRESPLNPRGGITFSFPL